MFQIKLFGTGQATYKGQPITGFPDHQASLLFCYLLLNPQTHHRERLAAVFWGDQAAATSRKHLSQTLWRLRNTFQSVAIPEGAYLNITGDRVAFDQASPYWLDIEEFEGKITQYQNIPGPQLTPTQVEDLQSAIDLYSGDLLEGVYDDWCLLDRERLNILYLEALGKLMIFHEHNKTFKQGISCGDRILRCDNTRERVHQQMMRLHWLNGDRAAALAHYKRCVQILRDELNIVPMRETTQLYEQILRHQIQPAPDVLLDTALSPLTRSELTLQTFASQSLQKLSRLQTIIDETSAELRSLEHLIKNTLLDSE
jgi:DNA-binding SARP family transcriptional activator